QTCRESPVQFDFAGRNAMIRMKVEFSVAQGSLKGRGVVFEGPGRIIVGRGEDWAIRLPSNRQHAGVSRHLCLLEIAPPGIRVRDLGSRNGTYVNGKRIGQQPDSQPSPETDGEPCQSVALRDGDEVRVGYTILRVTVREWNEGREVALLASEKESCAWLEITPLGNNSGYQVVGNSDDSCRCPWVDLHACNIARTDSTVALTARSALAEAERTSVVSTCARM